MTLEQQLDQLARCLGADPVTGNLHDKFQYYRGLVNRRPVQPVSAAYLELEAAVLTTYRQDHPIVCWEDGQPVPEQPAIRLIQADLTRVSADAIVNPANSQLLGCFQPCHDCLDNQIHSYAGIRLRHACAEWKADQCKRHLSVGEAMMTPGFHLPARAVIHTVGPQIQKLPVSAMMRDLLAKGYRQVLSLAEQEGLITIAIPCIATGEFGFPLGEATQIAVTTVVEYLAAHKSPLRVLFTVWTQAQYQAYQAAFAQLKGGS